jgi:hypothetical protein
LILLKNPPFIFCGAIGGAVEIIGDFPFMLRLVEAFMEFRQNHISKAPFTIFCRGGFIGASNFYQS